MTAESTVQMGQLASMPETFGVKHAARQLPDMPETAERDGIGHRDFLNMSWSCPPSPPIWTTTTPTAPSIAPKEETYKYF